ncbi:hypothetical protein D3C86_1296720 [compost metagenome]
MELNDIGTFIQDDLVGYLVLVTGKAIFRHLAILYDKSSGTGSTEGLVLKRTTLTQIQILKTKHSHFV